MTIPAFFESTPEWWRIVAAAVTVVAGWVASRYARRGMLSLARRAPGIPHATGLFAARAVQYTLVLLGVGIALAFLGANVQPLLAVALIVGVILLLVLRGAADNFAAGVLLQSRQPIRPGEWIEVETPGGVVSGVVTELTARSVKLETSDGRTVHVPNAHLLAEALVNESRRGARRGAVQVRMGRVPGSSIDDAVDIVRAAVVDALGGAEPRPEVRIITLSDRRVEAELVFWHDPANAADAHSAVVRAVGLALAPTGDFVVSSRPAPPALQPPEDVGPSGPVDASPSHEKENP